MTGGLAKQRCLQHPDREAAYRCPLCRCYYCRECGVEHEGRILCAACLKKLSAGGRRRPRRCSALAGVAPFIGFLVAWLIFFCLGQLLVSIPTSFHDGRFSP
jgi:hypothetical protein